MKPCILYIEDNFENRTLVERILKAEGFEYLGAESAEEGIQLALQHRPDIILMDINMPEVSGLAATQRIRALPEIAQTPVVALTANAMRHELEQTLQAGCDGYIIKPIDIDNFPNQILQFLRS
jgi:CheY-like chemotaxis protein